MPAASQEGTSGAARCPLPPDQGAEMQGPADSATLPRLAADAFLAPHVVVGCCHGLAHTLLLMRIVARGAHPPGAA